MLLGCEATCAQHSFLFSVLVECKKIVLKAVSDPFDGLVAKLLAIDVGSLGFKSQLSPTSDLSKWHSFVYSARHLALWCQH